MQNFGNDAPDLFLQIRRFIGYNEKKRFEDASNAFSFSQGEGALL